MDALFKDLARQAPRTGETGDGTADTMGSSQEGAVDTPSAPVERLAQYGGFVPWRAVDVSSAPIGRHGLNPAE